MKILFATLPLDGHFMPLTGIATYLSRTGHEVRWYTGRSYEGRLARLGIPLLPFRRANEITPSALAERFPERARLRGPALIRFDFEQFFIANVEAYFEDIREIDAAFPFDIMFCDTGFLGARLVHEALGKKVCGVGVGTVMLSSRDVPPNFIGKRPARTPLGRRLHRLLAAAMERMVLARGRDRYNEVLARYGLASVRGSIYDEFYRAQEVVFQIGVPGFEYPRREPLPTLRFVGDLRPARSASDSEVPALLATWKGPVVLVSQGTVDNQDPSKLMRPAMEALAGTDALAVVATGHCNTDQLRAAYPQKNIVVVDYVDFDAVLARANVFVCNGGYGSVMRALAKGVPLVVAGVREGKNDVNARVEHAGVGINLRTESPSAATIRIAYEQILREPRWRQAAARLREEMATYRPFEIIDAWLNETPDGRLALRDTR